MLTKALAIFLTANLLLGTLIDLHDVAKVPYMIAHYQQHKNKSNSFSVTEFFTLHYGAKAKTHDKEEHEQHKGLPFKTHDCRSVHLVTFLVAFAPSEIVTVAISASYNNFYQSAYSSSFSQSIWQPPKLS